MPDTVHGDFEWSEICFGLAAFDEILSRLVGGPDRPTRSLLGRTWLLLMFLRLTPLFGEAAGRDSGDVLCADEYVPHLCNFILHQVFVK